MTVLTCPESFNLTNNIMVQNDYESGLNSQNNMLLAMMGGGAMGGNFAEKLSSEA